MIIVNEYRLGRQLGVGTFGETYEAYKDGGRYAVKLIRAEAIQLGFDVGRFKHEVRSLQKAVGPNVVKLVDFGEANVGNEKRYYLVLEYLEGCDLGVAFDQANRSFDEAMLKGILTQVVRGLETVHKQKIVHRDLKPANVYVTTDGRVKLLDFGLAKMLEYTTLTATGHEDIGTPLYIAPELLKGATADYRADFYSLGVLIFHMVTCGQYPFYAPLKPSLYFQVVNNPPTLPTHYNTELSAEFEALILRLLSKEPYQRTLTHQELIAAIEKTPLTTKRSSVMQPELITTRRKRCLFHLLHNEKSVITGYLDTGGSVDGILFQASYLPRYRNTLDELKARQVPYSFDPVTYRLAYASFAQAQGLRDLPYVPNKDAILTESNFRTLTDFQTYARGVIDWQIQHGASILWAPFHFAQNLESPWVEIDIKLIEEAKTYAASIAPHLPVYAGICARLQAFTTNESRVALLNQYSRSCAEGYIFFMDEFDEKTNNPLLIKSYFRLIELFQSTGVAVFAARVGTLGLGFLAAGANGITNGVGSLTSFSEANLLVNRDIDYEIAPKYYVPALMLNLPLELANDLLGESRYTNLRCPCPYCQRGITRTAAKAHFLHCRTADVSELNGMVSAEQRLAWFRTKVEAALRECERIRKDKIIDLKTSHYAHLRVWLDVFQVAGVA